MTNEGDEMSAASCGSQPVAWALMQPDSYSVFASRALAEKKRVLCFGGDIVPLYRSPALTDEEREAVKRLCRAVTHYAAGGAVEGGRFASDDERAVVVVREWIDRLK